jgi:hypothetical protein
MQAMKPIESKTVTHEGKKYCISVYYDSDAPNPMEDDFGRGKIITLNRRQIGYDPDLVQDALDNNPDVVRLGYHEHGLCSWFVEGQGGAGTECVWDGVPFAGVWIPDTDVLDEAKNLTGAERLAFMTQRAKSVCETYTQWCNGDIYGYTIEEISHCDHCNSDTSQETDSCWGFYGMETAWEEAKAIIGIPD